MERTTYAVEASVSRDHWWFVVRRRLFAAVLQRWSVPRTAPILDVGTSTGTNLRMLKALRFENYTGLDLSEDATSYCVAESLGPMVRGNALRMPFDDACFDVVLATDIIEHIDDDHGALREIFRVMCPKAHLLVTVPAFESLWGLQDEVSHHKRRYRKALLIEALRESGFEVTDAYYFNYLLFLPIWLARQLIRVVRLPVKSENQINNPLVNRILTAIFDMDVSTARYLRPPFGVSILALANKPDRV